MALRTIGLSACGALAAGHLLLRATPAQLSHPPTLSGSSSTFCTSSGRCIAFCQYGTRDSLPIFYLHGLAGSRLEWLGSRSPAKQEHYVIAIDRPGYGYSDVRRSLSSLLSQAPVQFVESRTYLDFASDVLELADHLCIEKFAICAWSSGGPYALACARVIPTSRLLACSLVSSDCPWTIAPWSCFTPGHVVLYAIRRVCPWLFAPSLWIGSRLLLALLFFSRQSRMFARVAQAFRQGPRATVFEMLLERSDWGFRLSDISCPVTAYHGENDVLVSPNSSRFICSLLPRGELRLLAGEGHLVMQTKWSQILEETRLRAMSQLAQQQATAVLTPSPALARL